MPTQNAAAKPPGFLLKMRIVTPAGRPMAKKQFQIQWGTRLYPLRPGQKWETDAHGSLSVLLEEPSLQPPQGELLILEGGTVVWRIPLQICEEPPAVADPKDFVDDLEPSRPEQGASQQEVLDYYTAKETYDLVVVQKLEERITFFRQQHERLRKFASEMEGPMEESTSAGRLRTAWDEYCYYFAIAIRGYELGWRLWNLADLPLTQEPSIEVLASDRGLLLNAIRRFAFRHGMVPWSPQAVASSLAISPTLIEQCLERIAELHDKRGTLTP